MVTPGKPGRDDADRREIAWAVAKFALSGLAVLVAVAIGGALALRSLGTSQAIAEARRLTAVTGRGIVAPALDAGLLHGDRRALARLDGVVRSRVLSNTVVRVKVWTPDGRIVYSDEPRLIGHSYRLDSEELDALRTGSVAADVSDLSRPENRYERADGKLLQVYLGVRASDGSPLLFEQYLRYSSVAGSGGTIWRLFAPVLLVALVVLAALQIPLAWRMARRIRDGRRERERLLLRAVEASDAERRSIAAGLHDGVVQELAGISFRMSAAAERDDPEDRLRQALCAGAAGTRGAIRQLRTLLLEIYPQRLRDHGLHAALSDLASPLIARGVDVGLDLPAEDGLPPEVEQLVFRVAQEATRNIAAHAGAGHARISLTRTRDGAVLEIADDGRGFDAATVAGRRVEGHMGLQLLSDLVQSAGGRLEIVSAPGEGARLRLEVPVR